MGKTPQLLGICIPLTTRLYYCACTTNPMYCAEVSKGKIKIKKGCWVPPDGRKVVVLRALCGTGLLCLFFACFWGGRDKAQGVRKPRHWCWGPWPEGRCAGRSQGVWRGLGDPRAQCRIYSSVEERLLETLQKPARWDHPTGPPNQMDGWIYSTLPIREKRGIFSQTFRNLDDDYSRLYRPQKSPEKM